MTYFTKLFHLHTYSIKVKICTNSMRRTTTAHTTNHNKKSPLFIFEMNEKVTKHNATVLTDHNFDLNQIITQQIPSQIS